MFLRTIEQLRGIEFAKTFLWDIMFKDAPSPFNSWFPANDVEEGICGVDSYNFEAYLTQYSLPRALQMTELRITFFDNMNLVLEHWLKEWIMETMFNKGRAVSTIQECVKMVQVTKMNSRRETLNTKTYWVYPEGPVAYHGNSDSAAVIHSMNFKISGVVE